MPAPYQRIMVQGIPVWKDAAGRLYYYETSTPPTETTKILIGTEASGFNPDWKHLLDPSLRAYREASKTRSRAEKK